MSVEYTALVAADTVREIASALLRASGEMLKTHGNDPDNPAIVAAGFVMAIQSMDKVDPAIGKIIRKML